MAQASDPIEQAMIETNREIAAEAWGEEAVPLDTDNDRTPETTGDGLEGQHVEEDEAEELEAGEAEDGEAGEAEAGEGEGKTEPTKEEPDKGKTEAVKVEPEKPEGRVPPGVLREAKEKARALEAERDALKTELATSQTSSREEIKALNSRLDGVLAAIKQQQQPPKAQQQPEAEVVPDMFEDPKGFVEYLNKQWETKLNGVVAQVQKERVAGSFADAHSRHGEAFPKAMEAISALNSDDPAAKALVRNIWSSPNPGEALVQWHKRQEALREVGEDPAAYKTRITEETRKALLADPEFRKQVIADLRAEAGNGPDGKPRSITRLPPSLANANGGARAGQAAEIFDGSDQAVADFAWR